MCGFTGFLSSMPADAEDMCARVSSMASTIAYRGPDDSGCWVDPSAGVALGHKRLSILDLSEAGHQPMMSACGRYTVVFNGEVYNHLALRSLFPQVSWQGHADTETLLAAISVWGLVPTLKKIKGMFAFALWDKHEKALYLARDRLGEKPLYYGWYEHSFLFGSELKALKAHPDFVGEIDRGALALFLRHNYIPGPYSIYKGVAKLQPGMFLRVSLDRRSVVPQSYWSMADVAEQGVTKPFYGSSNEAIDLLSSKLSSSVSSQMLADVPIGALLSGGIDSSLICSVMQAVSNKPIKTFTVGFGDKNYDESIHAKAVAAHLGTEHTELRMGVSDILATVPKLPYIYDEPFADSSQLPTHLVMGLVKEHVTVVLSGDGGDELFSGYNRYRYAPKVWQKIRYLPKPLRQVISHLLTVLPASSVNQLFGSIANVAQLGDKAHKLGQRICSVNSVDDLYISLVSEWAETNDLVLAAKLPVNLLDSRHLWPQLQDPVERMMALDSMTYLPDDILVKVDRAAMAVSLETRVPFLDKDLVEFAWQLPLALKQSKDQSKWVLRELLYRYVPKELIDRPKMGFAIPLDNWLRGPLREWAETLLDEKRLREEGYLNPQPIRATWRAHIRKHGNYGYRLWSVLMFQAWLEANAAPLTRIIKAPT